MTINALCKVFSATARLQETPGAQSHIGRRDSELLHGELFRVDRYASGWAHGTSELDGYAGWIADSDLTLAAQRPTHAIIVAGTNAYTTPDAKTAPVRNLHFSFMSRMTVEPSIRKNGFVMLNQLSLWVPETHLMAIADLAQNPADIIDTANMFSTCPYTLGGRTPQGIDCSGLVQLSLQRNGIHCPRDADQQEHVIGIDARSLPLQRGDIVYFPGHVAMMVDDKDAINATMRHMKVITEPLSDLVQAYGPPTSIRRLTP